MRNTFLLLVLCFFISCNQGKRLRVDDLKSGRFKTVLEDEETESFATRNDSIQIEEYQGSVAQRLGRTALWSPT